MKTNTLKTLLLLVTAVVFSNTAVYAQYQSQTPYQAPQKLLNKWLWPGTSMFVSGMLDGTIESINYHYMNGFQPVFPHANPQFWNPSVSWVDKYKNNNPNMGPKYFGSTTFLSFTTDAYHLLRTGRNITDAFTLAFYVDRQCLHYKQTSFKQVLIDALILAAIRDIGFNTTYSLIFREGNHI